MHVSAIICEYNPLHNGHVYHIDKTRNLGATHIVSIMSSNFVQRGEPSCFSKKARVKMALSCGIDLVLELPSLWSMSPAEKFAFSAVHIANSLNVIDSLSFGCEDEDIELLTKVANSLNSLEIIDLIKDIMKKGMSFASAREKAVNELYGDEYSGLIKKPNNILAIEYIKTLERLGSGIKTIAVKREGVNHDSDKIISSYSSASQIRKLICTKNYNLDLIVPKSVLEIINEEIKNGHAPSSIYNIERAILYKIRLASKKELKNLFDISEGLENRIFNLVPSSNSLDELYKNIKSKRYAMSRIRRIILSDFLEINKDLVSLSPRYVRVLGFNSKGLEILKKAESVSNIPIITKASDIKKLDINSKLIFESEVKASDIYNLTLPNILNCKDELTSKILKSL